MSRSPSIFRRDESQRVFTGTVRDRVRAARRKWRKSEEEDEGERGPAVLATPFVPSVAAHREAVGNPITEIGEEAEFHGADLRVRNYILGIAESSQLPIDDVQNSRGVQSFAKSLGVDLEKVKFNITEEE